MLCSLSLFRHYSRSVLSTTFGISKLSISDLPRTSRKHTLHNHSKPFSITPQKCASAYEAVQCQTSAPSQNKHRFASSGSSKYVVNEQPLGTLSSLRVIIIGAGVNGLDMLYALQKKTKNVEYVIYEKNLECGGTWYENRYPGCASDDPSHHYQYTHTTNPSWSSVFAPAGEIKQYLNDFIDTNNLRDNIKCGYQICRAEWSEEDSHWKVTIKNKATGQISEEQSEILIDATGIFNDYKYPQMKGLTSFQGDLLHTANWPSAFNCDGKTVAVLGNGASGVQIVPAIQPDVKKLIHIIRSKTWIAPPSKAVRYCEQYTIDKSSNQFSASWRKILSENPKLYQEFIDEIDRLAREDRFKTVLKNSQEALSSKEFITAYMTSQLSSHKHLIEQLIPTNMPVGCRRLTSSTTYLPALCQPNVEVATSSIREVTPTGILLSSGTFHKVDAIICATGFNTSFLPRFPLIGSDAINLQETWAAKNGGPKAYMGILASHMPNYFRFLGPNSPLAHGTIPHLSSTISAYILSHIQKMQREGYDSIRVQPEAVEEFNEHVDTFMPRTAWADGGCGGWYRSADGEGEGRVTALHPGSQRHWEVMLRRVRWEDFEFRRKRGGGKGNRFVFLGNGEVVGEDRKLWFEGDSEVE